MLYIENVMLRVTESQLPKSWWYSAGDGIPQIVKARYG